MRSDAERVETRSHMVKRNKHPTSDGRPWGWVEAPDGSHVLRWRGLEERAMAKSRATELDRIGWEYLGEDERSKVRHGAIGDCEVLLKTRVDLGRARAKVDTLKRDLHQAVGAVELLEKQYELAQKVRKRP